MIPERAFFLWVGDGELSPLRQLSVNSFSKHNPDWKVEVIRIPPKADLAFAQVTDIFRYNELATRGGLYLDTDIVFFKPVPREVTESDLALTIDKSAFRYEPADPHHRQYVEHAPGFNNLAFLAAEPGSRFFSYVYEAALDRFEFLMQDNVDVKKLLYQAFGTEMLNRIFYGLTEQEIAERFSDKFYNVPLDLVLPVRWDKAHTLFNGTPFEPPEQTIGVHWYGGSVDARLYEKRTTKPPCYLTSAIHKALG